MIENLDALYDVFDDDSAAFDQRAFQDRYGDLLIVAANEHGDLVYATMPTDDPESDGPFVGIVTAQNTAWPIVPLFPADVEIRRHER